jgi:ribosome recycling factor
MVDDVITQAKSKMEKTVEVIISELAKVRAGRAHPSVIEHIMVNYYGSPTPLSQVANVSVVDSRTLSVNPWEKSLIDEIEKAIMKSSMGLNPSSAGTTIMVPLPPLTEERRKDLVKLVHKISENSRVSVRSARRDANQLIKQQLKDKLISEDQQRVSEDNIQDITNSFIKQIDELVKAKEEDLMQV